jgi:hypothetical protein
VMVEARLLWVQLTKRANSRAKVAADFLRNMIATSIKRIFSKRFEAVSGAMEQGGVASPRAQGQDPRFEKGRVVPEEISLAGHRLQA